MKNLINSHSNNCHQTDMEVSMTQFIVEGKLFELANFNSRNLFKLLREEGYLPKESAGKTKLNHVTDLLIHVSYKDIDIKVDLDLERSFVKDLNVFEIAQVQTLIAQEKYDYSCISDQWTMMADHIALHGTNVEHDADGHEIGADLVLNRPLGKVYTPKRYVEEGASIEPGTWLSPAALMVHPSELESLYEPDLNELYVKLRNYSPNVFTRANTITEQEAFENLFDALGRLASVETAQDLSALAKEIYAAQTATKYSQLYYFPKLGSKAFWDAYKAKKAELGVVTTKTEVDMKKFYDQLDACKNSKDLNAVREAVFNAPYSAEKNDFWKAYRAKKESLYADMAQERARVFTEICNAINSTNTAFLTPFEKINEQIYKAYLPIEVKKVLWFKVRTKIDEGSVEIDIEKGIKYMESLFTKAA